MPRPPRSDVAGQFYHALNRGNARQPIFHKDEDYEAFERIMKEGLEKYPVDLLCYQWMPNHWHMILMPREDGAGRLLYWVSMTHAARHHAHYHATGPSSVLALALNHAGIPTERALLWVESIVNRLNLESTMRPRGRPKLQHWAETNGKEA